MLKTLNFDISFDYRHVDDIIMTISSEANPVLQKFNFYYPRIQFTCEIGNKTINFLDITIIIENNVIKFNIYHKSYLSLEDILITN